MHLGEGREPFSVVTPKEEIDGLVGVDAEELSDDLYMVRTSESESFGAGPRLLMRRPLSRSSIRQKTETMKVLRSTVRDLLCFDWFGHHRA
jgi:hypothetical protein